MIIGNGGAEFGVRGYVTAYDAETGEQVWRFYTVPGDPAKADGAASDKMLAEMAAPTWNGEWWKLGGGGTVWDAIAYDPELDLLYIGTGNGSPVDRKAIRSTGGGDNLFLVLDRRAEARHRRICLALPDDAGRELGLHRDAADHRSPTSDRRRRRARC